MAVTVTELARKLEAEKLSATTVDALIPYIDQSRSSEWDRVKEHFGSKAEILSLNVEMTSRFNKIDSGIAVLEEKVGQLESRMDSMELKLEKLYEQEQKNFSTLMLTLVGVLVSIIGSFIGLLLSMR